MKHVFIVAEIGCNHNGSKELAKRMVESAKDCGVDAVKFQTFKAKDLISCYAPKAEYQKITTGTSDSQLEMTAKLELSHEDFLELKAYAEEIGLEVFSTPFDIGAIKREGKKVMLSSGMATIEEIENCIEILVNAGTKECDIILLHCNTEYPTPDKDVNILAINDLKKHFPNVKIGFSDHSVGYTAAIGAAVLGIDLIEKHFTLDKNYEGPDHKASATPNELKELVQNVRRVEVMAGSDKKIVTDSERKNKIVARKSIVALKKISVGEIFTEDNITCKRPGNGISPLYWYEVLGKVAERDFNEDELITVSGFEWQEC